MYNVNFIQNIINKPKRKFLTAGKTKEEYEKKIRTEINQKRKKLKTRSIFVMSSEIYKDTQKTFRNKFVQRIQLFYSAHLTNFVVE